MRNERPRWQVGKFTRSRRSDSYSLNKFAKNGSTDNGVPISIYSKNGAKTGKRKRKNTVLANIGRVLLSVMLIGIITACLVVGAFAVYVFGFVDDKIYEDLNQLKLDFTTTVYVLNKETNQYEEYQRLHGQDNRIWVDFDQMPQHLKDAFVAVEDKRFYEHTGVDWKRTLGAFANMFIDLYSSNQGGSTITQQLVKNLTGDNAQRPMRKIREIMRARYLEENYSKDIILECYLNTIALANGICGVEVASNFYFDKHTNELTLVECAALAAMAKEPERYRPDKNPENNKQRRNLVLSLMLEQGKISQAEYDEAVATELNVVASREVIKEVEVNSYFVDTLINDVINALIEEYNYDKTYASKNFYNGGYKIYSTLDLNVQKALDEVYKNDSLFNVKSKKKPGTPVQSCMTIMDYEGHIVAIIGGRGEKTVNRSLNRATDSPRQPGSTMKPIAAYAPALEYNLITYSSLIEDAPITIKENGVSKKWPKNAYSGYRGLTPVQNAIERSVNTIPVRIVQNLTPRKSFDFLTGKLGITTLVESMKNENGETITDINLAAMGLGGCVYGLTSRELTAAYATFGNLGKYYRPTTFIKVVDQHDNVILEQSTNPVVAMSEDTACVMNHLLQTVINGQYGTGRAAKFSSMPIYGKTGTTNDTFDLWFVGGTPYYVGACWLGFDEPEEMSGGSATRIWREVMKKVHEELEVKDFPQSEFVTYRKYCTSTGLLATTSCPSTSYGWYKTTYLPACTKHKGKLLDEVKIQENSSKPKNDTTSAPEDQTSNETSSEPTTTSSNVSSNSDATTSENSSSSAGSSSSNTQSYQSELENSE
ncbi:MAG TPA: penicillin-binding protein [Clostridiales bacterium]|nr:penicillin-binding protein [Clostridiales bacterium]